MSLARWKCPRCDQGKLAPRRARLDDTRRYCLECSEATGRLVERVCPTAQKARERRQTILAQAKQAQRQAQTAFPACLYEEWTRMCKLPSAREAMGRAFGTGPLLVLRAGVNGVRWGTSMGGKVIVYYARHRLPSQVRATMLHELAHEIVNVKRRAMARRVGAGLARRFCSSHGDVFRATFKALVDDYTGSNLKLNGINGIGLKGRLLDDTATEMISKQATAAATVGNFIGGPR